MIALAGDSKAETFKIGVLADLHLQPNYLPDISPD